MEEGHQNPGTRGSYREPKAIAPPLTMAGSIPPSSRSIPRRAASDWAAKASLSSTSSTSPNRHPAFARAFAVAGTAGLTLISSDTNFDDPKTGKPNDG